MSNINKDTKWVFLIIAVRVLCAKVLIMQESFLDVRT